MTLINYTDDFRKQTEKKIKTRNYNSPMFVPREALFVFYVHTSRYLSVKQAKMRRIKMAVQRPCQRNYCTRIEPAKQRARWNLQKLQIVAYHAIVKFE